MKFNSSVAIYGAGGQARVVASIVRRLGGTVLGFFDNSFRGEEHIDGVPVLGFFQDILSVRDTCCTACIALGNNRERREAFFFLSEHGFHLPALIHPQALVEDDATVGEGSVVCIGAMLGTKAAVGRGAILNTGASVDHESHIGDFVHLAPQAAVAGRTRVGQGAFIGMSAVVADQLDVGEWAVIGAGAIVLANVASGARVYGIHH